MKTLPLSQGRNAIVDDDDFTWLSQWKWTLTVRSDRRIGYAYRWQGNRMVLMHRQILGIVERPNMFTDHINGIGLDNRRCNLRVCTHMENMRNQRKTRSNTTSQYKGVSWKSDWGKWEAKIRVRYRLVHLGGFETEEAAALAYNEAAQEHFGEFARLNPIPEEAA